MAHVHGTAATGAAQASKHAAEAAQHSAHAANAAAEHGAHLAQAARHQAAATQSLLTKAAPIVATGAAATPVGRSWLGRVLGHPLVLFGLGVAVGYSIHKYRKEIIESANRAAEKSKDFVLQQRENLEDIVAESQITDQ